MFECRVEAHCFGKFIEIARRTKTICDKASLNLTLSAYTINKVPSVQRPSPYQRPYRRPSRCRYVLQKCEAWSIAYHFPA